MDPGRVVVLLKIQFVINETTPTPADVVMLRQIRQQLTRNNIDVEEISTLDVLDSESDNSEMEVIDSDIEEAETSWASQKKPYSPLQSPTNSSSDFLPSPPKRQSIDLPTEYLENAYKYWTKQPKHGKLQLAPRHKAIDGTSNRLKFITVQKTFRHLRYEHQLCRFENSLKGISITRINEEAWNLFK